MQAKRKEMIFALAIFLGIPVIAECALRIAGVEFGVPLYMPDRERGWVLRPGATSLVDVEAPQHVRINRQGFHDVERSYDKPADAFRIAVLGNSWTEALQVAVDRNFTAILQQELRRSTCFGGKQVEVLNFGVAGYSTGQELLLLRQEVWKYHPDLVLLAFYPARDIANNIRELNNAVNAEQSPYFLVHGNQVVFDDSFRAVPALQQRQIAVQSIRYQFAQHSRMLQLIFSLQNDVRIGVATATLKERAQQSGVNDLEYAIYGPPTRADMQTAWSVTEALFVTMRDEVASHGAEFNIVTIATRPQVTPDPEKRAEFARKLGVGDLNYADERIRRFGARGNISVIPLAPALSAYAEAHHVYLNGFNESNQGAGHWNETGHRVAAETIAAALCANVATASEVGR